MPLPGGPTDKFGNRYEGRWTVSEMVRLLEEHADSIRLEPPGPDGDGIEFWLRREATLEYHQVKRQHSGSGHWTISDLDRAGVVASFGARLADPTARCVFVSARSSHELQELIERAQAAADYGEFKAVFISARDVANAFGKLTDAWRCDSQETYGRLRRTSVVVIDEETLADTVLARLASLVDGDPPTVLDVLAQYALANVHHEFTALEVWAHLARRGFQRRDWGGNPSVIAAIEEASRRYLRPLEGSFINASYLARPEADLLIGSITTTGAGERGALVLGGAGSGKSCVLWRLVRGLLDTGIPVLAFRLDRLEPRLLPEHVGHDLGLPGSPAAVLGAVAKDRPSVLVIDQLDAVSLASGRHPDFLDCVNEIIRQARAFPRMRLILACRKWDLDNDPRLRGFASTDSPYSQVILGGFPHDVVKEVLTAMGLDTDRVSKKQMALLELPLHLSLLAEGSEDGRPKDLTFLKTATDLYDRFWDRKQVNLRHRLGRDIRWTRVVDTLCEFMSERQRLTAPAELLDDYDADTRAMVSERVLVQDGKNLAFFHEGFFDYCFARRFAVRGHRLVAFLTDGEQQLFRRAQLRQILHHERDRDFEAYLIDLEELLRSEGVRYHLKQVVFSFLALVPSPSCEEWQVLSSFLDQQPYRSEILRLLTVLPWFELAHSLGVLQQWLTSGVDSVEDDATWLMRSVQEEEGDLVAELLEPHAADDRWSKRLLWVVQWSRLGKSRRFLDLFLMLLDRGNLDDARGPIAVNSDFWSIVYGLPKKRPDWACEVIGHYLQRRLRVALGAGGRNPFDMEKGTIRSTAHGPDIFTDAARGAPLTFIQEVLPFALKVMELTSLPPKDGTPYWYDQVWSWRVNDAGLAVDDFLLSGLVVAFTKLALDDPDTFLVLLYELRAMPYETVQFLLIKGLSANPKQLGDVAVDYLIAQPSRFSCGYSGSPYWASRQLIKSASAWCTQASLDRLESAVLGYYPPWERNRPTRLGYAQYVLLDGMDASRRSQQATRRFQEWQRKFGDDGIRRPQTFTMQAVGSPIASSAASKMTDDQWLTAMAKHSTDTERFRRSGEITGGAVELSHVLEERAAAQPQRYAKLALRMPDSTNPAYFDAILLGVGKAQEVLSPDVVMQLCTRCHALPGKTCGRWIHKPIMKLGSGRVPVELLDLLSWYATQDPDPDHEEWREMASSGIAYYRGDMLTAGLNSVRGSAIDAVGDLLYADPERGTYLTPTIHASAHDRMLSVRSMAAHALCALLLCDRNLAVREFLDLCDADDLLLATHYVEHFLHYAASTHYAELEPVLRRMIASSHPAVAQAGARQVCVASISCSDAAPLADLCLSGSEPLRLGAAEVYAANVEVASLRVLCHRNLLTLANDLSSKVREAAAACFFRWKDVAAPENGAFLEDFVRTPAFAENPHSLLYALEEATERLPRVAIAICEQFIMNAGAASGDISTSTAADAHTVSKLILRLYNQARDAQTRHLCLDMIDTMTRLRSMGILDELTAHDR